MNFNTACTHRNVQVTSPIHAGSCGLQAMIKQIFFFLIMLYGPDVQSSEQERSSGIALFTIFFLCHASQVEKHAARATEVLGDVDVSNFLLQEYRAVDPARPEEENR